MHSQFVPFVPLDGWMAGWMDGWLVGDLVNNPNPSFPFQVSDTETRLECLLNNNKNSDFCAPLTSFDWNEVDPNLLGQ